MFVNLPDDTVKFLIDRGVAFVGSGLRRGYLTRVEAESRLAILHALRKQGSPFTDSQYHTLCRIAKTAPERHMPQEERERRMNELKTKRHDIGAFLREEGLT